MRIAAVIALVAVVTFLALSLLPGGYGGPPEGNGLIARLYLDGGRTSFRSGELIKMRLEITNRTEDVVEILYPERPRYTFSVYRVNGDAPIGVWYWEPEPDSDLPNPQQWSDGETVIFQGVWDQTDYDGKQLPPGQYVAHATNAACHTGVSFHCDTTWNARFEILSIDSP